MIEVLDETEWFYAFYPEEWGDWTISYNMRAYREDPDRTPCTWMDYCMTGYLSREDPITGLMKVNDSSWGYRLEHFFVSKAPGFIQPIYNPINKEHYARVRVTKVESNLDLYEIYVSGGDDASYTKHFFDYKLLQAEIKNIKANGIAHVYKKSSEYFFTN
jgi:hypothetical protein